MYTSALKTLTQIKLEILAGLCYGDVLLPNLWTLLQSLGPFCGQKVFIGNLNFYVINGFLKIITCK